MLPLQFRSLDFVTVACPHDVLACLQVFPALAVDAFLGEELPQEFSCVCVSGAALDQAAKYLSLGLEFREMFGGVEGWPCPVGYCESPLAGRSPLYKTERLMERPEQHSK